MTVHFRDLLIEKLQEILRQDTPAGYGSDNEEINIVMCNFVYNNDALIKKLQERGTLIKETEDAESWKKVEDASKEIDEMIEKDNEIDEKSKEKMMRPTACFITFETEEGF